MPSLVLKTTATKNTAVPVRVGGAATKLTTAISGATTSLVVSSLPGQVASGDRISIVGLARGTWANCTASGPATGTGPYTIPVNSFTPAQTMPVGSTVKAVKWPGADREYVIGQNVPHEIPAEDYGEVCAFLAGNVSGATITKGPKDH